jgi:hypothetical protein
MYEQGVRDILHGTGRETFDAVKVLKSANPQRFAPENGAQYPRGRLGESLKQIAQLIKADVGLEVAFAEMRRTPAIPSSHSHRRPRSCRCTRCEDLRSGGGG